jgi:RHS repeat-associated protein
VKNQTNEGCAFEWNYTVPIPDNLWVAGTNLIAVQARDRGIDTGFEFDLVGPSSLIAAKPQTLLMSTNANNGQSSLTIAPAANFTQILGQPTTFTALVTNASGTPAPNIQVFFNVAGANPQQVAITTSAAGTALFTYDGFFAGTDTVEASAVVGTSPVVSTQTQVLWTYQTNLPQNGTLVLSPSTPQNQVVGNPQTFTVEALSGSGQPVANVPVTLLVSIANTQQMNGITNSSGIATFNYSGAIAGTDTVEADANINGTAAFSNLDTVTWTGKSGGGTSCAFTPQGWIGTPAIGAVVQNPISIMLASGVTLASGTLQYFPSANPSQVTVLNSNTTGTGPISLGTFDPTQLASGQYTIQLQSTNSASVCQLNEIVLSVSGANKLGRETVTVTDFKVPLAGIPISITRTYDSLNRNTVQDFGNGWALGASVNLQVDQLMDVTFTLNGNPQTFYFTPQSAGQWLFPWMLSPAYTPQPGFHGTLTTNGCGILIYSGGTLVQDQSGAACFPGGSYQPTIYTYTDPSGRVYTMTNTGQLQTIKDLDGNILSFTPTGITSTSGGVVVPFIRDSKNRITQITDLNKNTYIYGYDTCSTGDLCSVTFPGITTPAAYTYYTDTSLDLHLLKTQTDPNGNMWTNTYYTTDGRLETVTSPYVPGPGGTSAPYLTQYSYNLTTNATTTTNPDGGIVVQTIDGFGKPLVITDALNHTTTYTYDSKENLISQTDALGNVTSYTYDANGNQTSATDPVGNTSTKLYNQYSEITTSSDALQPPNVTNFFYDPNFNPNQATDSIGQLYAATYDNEGNAVTQTDANGNTTQLTYDARGNLVKVVDPLNEVTTFTYDAMDRILSKTDPRQNQMLYSYDALGNLTDTTDALGHVTRSTYDLNSNKLSDIDALGRTTSYTYDALNRLIKVIYPDSTMKQYTYDFRNNKTSEVDQLGRTNLYVYDQAGELKTVTYASATSDAGTVTYAYYPNGLKQKVTDEVNNPTNYFYDTVSRLTSVKDAMGNTTSYGYDNDDRRTSMIDANLNKTQYAYDARSRLQTVIFPDTTTDGYTWDGVGNQLTATDQALNKTTRKYDQVNRLYQVIDPLSNVTQYGYDPASNLQSITDANGHITAFQYNSLNRMSLRALPLGMVETYSYDAVGNLAAKTDFNGKTTTYSYDPLHRLLMKVPDPTLSEPTISFTYNPTGTRLSMTDPSGTTNYTTYDNRNRLKTETTPEGTLNYTYDAHSNLLSILSSNTNGASVTYTPDPLNRVGTVTDNRLVAQGVSNATTTYNYYPVGTLQNYTYAANSVQTAYTYDTLNRLHSVGSTKGTTGLSSFTYTPYPAGNVNTVAELSGRNVTYVYDTDYHLKSETIAADPGGNNGAESYNYDAVGNRKTLSSTIPSLPGSVSYNYDANDRLTTDTYDSDGNTLSSAGTASTYDFENRMLTHGSVSMVYDGDGNRVSETAGGVTTKYLIDSLNPTGYSQVLDELVSGSVTRTYAYGLQRISENQLVSSTWTPSFYGYDGHGNVRFLTSTTGAVGNTYQFDAFGMPIASAGTTANTYLYSGERFDQNIGLYHLRARYYNQNTGRFETMDPELGKSFNPATLHKYLYANANPTNRVDPLGLDAFEYATDLQVVFKTHGLDHLLAEGLELTQPEVEAYVEQLVREIIQEEGVSPGALIDIPFLMSQLGNVPWAARIFILTDALIEVTTYFPINK